jgi:hypothetical protein
MVTMEFTNLLTYCLYVLTNGKMNRFGLFSTHTRAKPTNFLGLSLKEKHLFVYESYF